MEYKLRSAGNRNMAVAVLVLLIITILALVLCLRIYNDNRALTQKILNNRQTIIVPYGANTPFSFTGERGDARYLMLMAQAWLSLRLNVSDTNVDKTHEMLLAGACDEAEKSLKGVLADEEARLKGTSGGSVFYVKDFKVWTDSGIVDFWGDLKLSYGVEDGKPVKKHYRIRTDTRNNRLCWSAFLEVPDA